MNIHKRFPGELPEVIRANIGQPANFGLQASMALDELIEVLQTFRPASDSVDRMGLVIIDVLRGGRKLLTCGNGGSATHASHLAEELGGRYKGDRRPLPAICLASDPALITCIANDFGYENVFSRQIEALAQPGDMVIAFSTSGNSPNTLKALDAARKAGAISLSVLGKRGGLMAGKATHEVIVPSDTTARIQEVHTLILHSWLEQIEAEFGGA